MVVALRNPALKERHWTRAAAAVAAAGGGALEGAPNREAFTLQVGV